MPSDLTYSVLWCCLCRSSTHSFNHSPPNRPPCKVVASSSLNVLRLTVLGVSNGTESTNINLLGWGFEGVGNTTNVLISSSLEEGCNPKGCKHRIN
jgi:hypothetical protein